MKKLNRYMIEMVLQDEEETREDDEKLFRAILKRYEIYILELEVVKAANLVKRERARFNQLGKYLPTSTKVILRRKLDEDKCREAYRHREVLVMGQR